MSRLTRAMSPAAMVISILALIVATSATSAYAATKIGTKQLKDSAVTSAKIKNKTIKTSDLATATATSLRGQTGPQGAPGTPGAAGSARAYATVSTTGASSLVAARTSGFTAVSRNGTGEYCLTVDPARGIDTTKVSVVVGVDWGGSSGNNLAAYWQLGGCGLGKISVFTFQTTGGTNVFANTIGFTVLVP